MKLPLYLIRRLVLILATTAFASSNRVMADDPPKPPTLTDSQKERLKERDRLSEQSQKLQAEGKLPEAIDATRELMIRFYKNLWEKKQTPLEALRQAQLSILDDPKFGDGGNPRLWAAWTLSGDSGGLPKLDPPAQPAPEAKK
jgi:hypothetical protein